MADTRLSKSLRLEIKDAAKGLVEAVFATFNVKDYGDDVTLPGAFENGAPVLISAYGHKSWMGAKPVGKGIIQTDATKAWLEGQFFLDTIDGLDTFSTIKGTGDLQQWSYGFDILETGEVTEGMRQSGVWRVIKKARVYEVSPVMLAEGVDTQTLSVKEKLANEAAIAELQTKARQEFARFIRTSARLAS